MKALIFVPQFFQLSGAERLGLELAKHLNLSGIHADIVTMYSDEIPGGAEVKKQLLKDGIPEVHFLNMKVGAGLFSVLRASLRLRRLIKRHEYEIVEASLNGASTIASFATYGLGIPLIVGLHHSYNPTVVNGPKALIWRFAVKMNRSARFYAISESVAASAIEHSGISKEKLRIVYNGIIPEYFESGTRHSTIRDELSIPLDSKIALYVGRLVYSKGIETLVEALVPVLETQNIHVLMVGVKLYPEGILDGETGVFDRIDDLIVKHNVSNRIHFLGPREDVPLLMRNADLLVHPTWSEGFGLTLVEALASGLPIVSTRVDAIPEILDQTDSEMVPAKDAQAFRKAILRVISRGSDVKIAAAARGFERAKLFTMQTRVRAMMKLFEDAISGGNSG